MLKLTVAALLCLPVPSGLMAVDQGAAAVATLTVTGSVTDPSGAKLRGARIHIERGAVKADAETDDAGRFSLDVPAGVYRLAITADGFEPYVRESFNVRARMAPLTVALPVATLSEVLTVEANQADTSAGSNGSALVFKGKQLDTLSNDDATFQQQVQALAGGDGQHAPQVYVDGFSGGRFPPKSAIREIRINQNPFSAQYDELGFGRIEIFTKPGSDKLHGYVQVQGNDRSFNALNPFTGAQPPYHMLFVDGNVSGPIGKKTSFFASANYGDQENNAVVNAVVLDSNFATTQLSQAVPNPSVRHDYSVRLDRQMSTNNTLTARYDYNSNNQTNAGVGLLVLQSEGYNSTIATQTLQIGNTQIIGAHRVNETRFQYIRTRTSQIAVDSSPTIVVQGSFNGGGAPSQSLRDNQDRYEFQDYFSLERGKHFLRMGGRYRLLRDSNVSNANFNGQYIFPDLATYQITQRGLAAGLTPAQIRAQGGGATQFSLTAGTPGAALLSGDLGLYADDEWKVTKSVTLNLGLRYESQFGVPDHSDPAPRVGFAWAVHQGDKHPAWFTVRGGTGVFYSRLDGPTLLNTVRQNGILQQSYYLQQPDTYPNIPPVSSLSGVPSTTYSLQPRLRNQYDFTSSIGVERGLGKKGNISATYLHFQSVHQYVSVNVNAPLPGTYNPAVPNSGTRPFGDTANRYEYTGEGSGTSDVFFVNPNYSPVKQVNLWGFYVNQHSHSNSNGASTFASNSYNLAQDFGRTNFNRTNRLFLGANLNLPYGFGLSPFLIATAGMPFNITTGSDNNGDSIYNDRPAFATDLTRASVVRTRFGNFDTSPIAGQRIIPVNYGTGPAFASLQLDLEKNFKFGPRRAPEGVPPPDPNAKPGTPAPKPDPAYQLSFSVEAQNVTNHTNGATPVGVLTSPFFGQSLTLNGNFFNNSAANRTVLLQTAFRF
ncbi:TonB-dependent receptor [Terriglobus aquaticus]|uniref:Carboxypeptidase regulatory-like domain-containing protein n=1 Tax=Terriglobus aquaticus TaxID=940139 RepID=A0ABW9KQL7_9BACT|nr:carboxypeptidase regulatory-like domain-containing protein [Terriglobus aquaticus]